MASSAYERKLEALVVKLMDLMIQMVEANVMIPSTPKLSKWDMETIRRLMPQLPESTPNPETPI